MSVVHRSRSIGIDWVADGPIGPYVHAFKRHLTECRYAISICAAYLAGITHFARWARSRRLRLHRIDEGSITEFLDEHLPSCHCAGPTRHDRRDLSAALTHLLVVLRAQGAIVSPTVGTTKVEAELLRYDQYMEHARGLAPRTRDMALRIVGRLLTARFGDGVLDIPEIQPEHVRRFFAQQAELSSKPASAGSVLVSLRGNFRYPTSLWRPRSRSDRSGVLPCQLVAILATQDADGILQQRMPHGRTLRWVQLVLRKSNMARIESPVSSGRVVQIDRYGSASELKEATVEICPLKADEVRIRTSYAGVNYTDVQIRAGNWPLRRLDAFPYVPGIEAAGIVVETGQDVSGLAIGDAVITMMQGLGGVRAERTGGYAEFVTVSADAVASIPSGVDLAALSCLGLPGVTAYEGLRRLGPLRGKEILVTGAAGNVGSAAVSIASAMGAVVTALVTHIGQADEVRRRGASHVVICQRLELPALAPQSFEGVLDVVGGTWFAPCVDALRARGTLSLVGAAAGGAVAFDAWQLIRPVTLTGYSTEDLDGPALRSAIAVLSALLLDGSVLPPSPRLMPLRLASHAHDDMERGRGAGRILLTP